MRLKQNQRKSSNERIENKRIDEEKRKAEKAYESNNDTRNTRMIHKNKVTNFSIS
ncbi:hypothetical protein HYD72_03765 [Mycoplasmopsis bovis]|nr:hypothetical protein [Mycoplasmopsis bovis]QQH49384.1 hypothetical protein HYD72_03765 [Mycoplasmopsis bovis]